MRKNTGSFTVTLCLNLLNTQSLNFNDWYMKLHVDYGSFSSVDRILNII